MSALSPRCPQAPPVPAGGLGEDPRGCPTVSPPSLAACGTFGDNLALGAEALLPGSLQAAGRLSRSLCWWRSDPEELLLGLGFGGADSGVAPRVPPRFFSAPSRASGIDLRLFVRAQARRRQMEDPALLLARRFQRVQALAATADAFFCLYCSVSRRSAPPRPCRDSPDSAEPRGAPPGRRLKLAGSWLGGGHGDTPRGTTLGPPQPPGTGGGFGRTPRAGGGDGDTGGLSPRSPPVGTAWGHPRRGCPLGRGLWGSGGAARGGTKGAAAPGGDVTVSPRPGAVSPHPSRVGVPHLQRHQGHPGPGSQCHPSATAGAGGHRGGPPGLKLPGRVPWALAPRGAAESLELEEVLSEEEEEGDSEDDEEEEEEAALSPHPSFRSRRSSPFPRRFAEEPLPPSGTPGPAWVT
ncbi:protein TESPA1 [Prinia subflava]|uniref:protein TESPA1 n=1 Tax=Prinia subflava TaxID=208062 RepID=UPI002FE41648